MSNLRPLAMQAIAHWKEHLPQMHARLLETGQLENEALRAAEQTLQEEADLIGQGFQSTEAWEMVREKYLFLPEEPETTPEPEEDEGYKTMAAHYRDLGRLGMDEADE